MLPIEIITSNSCLPPISPINSNSDAFIVDARQKQILRLYRNFYSKGMQQTVRKKQPLSQKLTHRLILKKSNVPNPPPSFADNEYMSSRNVEPSQRIYISFYQMIWYMEASTNRLPILIQDEHDPLSLCELGS